MDGFKRRLKSSLRFRLSVFLSLAIVTVSVFVALFSLKAAYDEAHELQDDTLREISLHYDPAHLPNVDIKTRASSSLSDPESKILLQYKRNDGRIFKANHEANLFQNEPENGFRTAKLNDTEYRLFYRTLSDGTQIAIAQETSVRDEIAGDSALRALMPTVVLIPVLLYLVYDIISKLFTPLQRLASELDKRKPSDLSPLDESQLPDEIQAFGTAINRQFQRVEDSMETQRRFIADAAHELRSPLTALSLQMEMLEPDERSPESEERFKKMQTGLERTRKLLEQLLDLARAEATGKDSNLTASTGLHQVLKRVMEEYMPVAQSKQIDLGAEGEFDCTIPLADFALYTALRNLVDNAIRYTPCGGQVTVAAHLLDNQALIEVIDNGPGISAKDQSRVFDPFFRVLGSGETGSGLGLAIVSKTLVQGNGTVEIISPNSSKGCGTTIRLIFPKA